MFLIQSSFIAKYYIPSYLVRLFSLSIVLYLRLLLSQGSTYLDLITNAYKGHRACTVRKKSYIISTSTVWNNYNISMIEFLFCSIPTSHHHHHFTHTTSTAGLRPHSLRAPDIISSSEPILPTLSYANLFVLMTIDWPRTVCLDQYPTPAAVPRATTDSDTGETSETHHDPGWNSGRPPPGTLPKSADDLPSPARALLMRLLERDPKVRMRNLRQLQQSAFYMGFNFENVKAKKVNPKYLLQKHYPEGPLESTSRDQINQTVLASFNQPLQNF
ncbi:hypothetical protein ABMA27_016497 [Loxostege sticticalis]|uniref:Uncharacterized protein n=1 Tax=Loxostege sticticalis TaxID=481309 RepID=A0ABR3I2I9_LOXSC